jgi:hypothetical protein
MFSYPYNTIVLWIETVAGWEFCGSEAKYHQILRSLDKTQAVVQARITPLMLASWIMMFGIVITFLVMPTLNQHVALLMLTAYAFVTVVLSNPCVLHSDVIWTQISLPINQVKPEKI